MRWVAGGLAGTVLGAVILHIVVGAPISTAALEASAPLPTLAVKA